MFVRWASVVVLGMTGCTDILFRAGCKAADEGLAKRNFKQLCTIATEFQWAEYSDAQMTAAFLEKVQQEIVPSKLFTETMSALAVAPPDIKFLMLQKSAQEAGIENYDCPALKDYVEGKKLRNQD